MQIEQGRLLFSAIFINSCRTKTANSSAALRYDRIEREIGMAYYHAIKEEPVK
jgi:hypothetical protein